MALGSAQSRGLRARALVVLGLLTAVGLSASVATRNFDWRDERAFYESVAQKAPANERALGNLIFIYADAQAWEDALAPCAAMAPRWTAGGEAQRNALTRCLEAAARLGRTEVQVELAARATTDQPDWGLGWRHLADARFARGEMDAALASSSRWWSIARSRDAVEIGVRAANAMAAAGRVITEPDRAWLLEGLTTTTALTNEGIFLGARLFAALGDLPAALRVLDGCPAVADDASLRTLYCDVALRSGQARALCAVPEGSADER